VGGARRRRELAGIVALFVAFALLARFVGGELTRPPLPEAGSPSLREAPEFSLPTTGDEVRRLTDHEGRVVLLNFWAIWCAPCRKELSALEALHAELGDEGLAIVAVNVDRGGAERVQRFAEQKGLSFEILLDPQQRAAVGYGVVGYPTTVVIDRAGRIVFSEVGAWDWSHPEAVAWFRELLTR
jgi:peroxiredoxin